MIGIRSLCVKSHLRFVSAIFLVMDRLYRSAGPGF